MKPNKKINKYLQKAIACIVCFFVCIHCLPLTSFAFIQSTTTTPIGGYNIQIPAVELDGKTYANINFLTTKIDGIRYVLKENLNVGERVRDYIIEKYEDAIEGLKKSKRKGHKYTAEDPDTAYVDEWNEPRNQNADGSKKWPTIEAYLKETKSLEKIGGKWVKVGSTVKKAKITSYIADNEIKKKGNVDNFTYDLEFENGTTKSYSQTTAAPTKEEYQDAKSMDKDNPPTGYPSCSGWHETAVEQETKTFSREVEEKDGNGQIIYKDTLKDSNGNPQTYTVNDRNGNPQTYYRYDPGSGLPKEAQTVYRPTQDEALDYVLQKADGQMIIPECLPAVLYDLGQIGTVENYYIDGSGNQVVNQSKNIDYAYKEYDRKDKKDKGSKIPFPSQFYFDPTKPNQPIEDVYFECDKNKKVPEGQNKGKNAHDTFDDSVINGTHLLIGGEDYIHMSRETCLKTEKDSSGNIIKEAGKEYDVDKVYTLDGQLTKYKKADGVPIHAGIKYYYDVEYYIDDKRPNTFYGANWNAGIDHDLEEPGCWTYIDPETGEEQTRFGRFYITDTTPESGSLSGNLMERRMIFEAKATSVTNPKGEATSLPAMQVDFKVTGPAPNYEDRNDSNTDGAVVWYQIQYKTIDGQTLKIYDWIPINGEEITECTWEDGGGTRHTAPVSEYTPSTELEYYYATGFNIEEYIYKAEQDWEVWETNYPGKLDMSTMPIIAVNKSLTDAEMASSKKGFESIIYKMRYSGWEKMKSTIMEFLVKPWEMYDTTVIQTFIDTMKNLAFGLLVLYFLIDLIGKILAFDFSLDALIGALVKLLIAKVVIEIAPDICELMYNISINYADKVWNSSPVLFDNGIIPKLSVDIFGPQVSTTLKTLSYTITGASPVLATLYPLFGFLLMGIILIMPIFINGVVVIIGWIQLIQLYVRYIEIIILYMFSPLAAASFASGEFKHVGKGFMLNFAAICMQSAIIILGMRIIDGLIDPPTVTTGWGSVIDFITTILDPLGGIVNSLMPAIMMTILIPKSRSFAKTVLGE